ncbi:MAG: universal stress protein [Acidobacteriota bacterium]
MENVKKIMFPVDLSGVSPKIAETALAMAKKFDAELHLLLVAETLDQYAYFEGSALSFEKLYGEIQAAAEKQLKKFQDQYCQGCSKLKSVILRGDPASEIVNYIRREDIDLVVMGTHGRKGLDRALFGSVAEAVVREAPVPVLTVNPYRKK